MKRRSLFTLGVIGFAIALFGCTNTPPPPKPFMGILDARKLGAGPWEQSQYEVVVHYEDIAPGKYELKIGFGYLPADENLKHMVADAMGVYAIAYTKVLDNPAGDVRVTLSPTVVRELGGTLNGRIHAILSPSPHGKEWVITKHDVFVLPGT